MARELDIELAEILNEFSSEVQRAMEASAEETAEEIVQELKSTSPKKTGKYARSWKVKEVGSVTGKKAVVFNTRGQLTHLLEFGHGLRGGGRTRAFPHIKPAEEKAKKSFEQKLRDKIGK